MGRYAMETDEPAIMKELFFTPGTGRFQGIALKEETYWAQYRVKLADVRAQARALVEAAQGDAIMEGVDFLRDLRGDDAVDAAVEFLEE
jgi:hypothetical protein